MAPPLAFGAAAVPHPAPTLAILHWIYKDVEVSVNRAQWLRLLNPGTPVFCLFGGDPAQAEPFRVALGDLVDDFYVFEEDCSAYEKWLHCDRLLTAWHRDRGRTLDWDTLFIAQWDLALLAPVRTLCGSLGPGEVLFSGARPIADVRHFWSWLKPGSESERDFELFRQELERRDWLPVNPLCCNLVAAALPRDYLDRYVVDAPRLGFSEYKMPMLAQSWGFAFCTDHELDIAWIRERPSARWRRRLIRLHAESGEPVHASVVAANTAWPWGGRAFHPFTRPVPLWAAKLPTIAVHTA